MKAELKQQWLGALRGGEYTQGQGHLKAAHECETIHCCLGVLRELAGLPWVETGDGESEWTAYRAPDRVHANGWLHKDECRDLGLDFDLAHELACLNDGLGSRKQHSFAEIADVIERGVLVD